MSEPRPAEERSLSAAEQHVLDFSLGRGEPVPGPDAAELRALVLHVRAQLPDEEPAAERCGALVEAAQQRAAELGSVSMWSLLRGGLRTNMLLRVVAASLVVHLAALPVLAWLHFSAGERPALMIHFEEPPPVLTAEPQPELLEAIEVPELLELPDLPGR